ncbi:Abi family protein [Enterococcus faecalis]|uniref:Abi family protein n=1 Tax=Enterococcus TaxID=1350 RepID=UPI00094F2C6D|nr:Abi family protein [Enterococcus faecalis]EGO9141760.1 Abi family protein [Enterococcus faecalis]EGO9240019.1 Abi family protein [Enterococcus faecalis]EKK5253968.1 Abi family protein [Enterococcus faecalis]MDT2124925.1 Abi family protein [Enterococcus faecalis]NRC61804.1 Abi family protein [Enterococcus faecalis]
MAIKPWKNLSDLANTLEKDRNLKVPDSAHLMNQLKRINYFQLINGHEKMLLPDSSHRPKKFETETFADFEALYWFNKKLSETILSIIANFEIRLKTSVAYHFSKNHCSTINDTMQYTNKSNYIDIGTDSSYPFKTYQYKNIHSDFQKFILFKTNFLNTLISKNDFIDSSFYKSANYIAPQGCCVFSHDSNVAVPLWVAIQTLDFGALKRMCHYLQPTDIYDVLNDFGLPRGKKFFFLNLLDIIHELRNKCAHFSLMHRFETPSSLQINNDVVNELSLSPKDVNPNFRLSLFDALKVLSYFENTKPILKVLKSIIYRNNKLFKRKSYDLNQRILTRMGEPNYKEWKNSLT